MTYVDHPRNPTRISPRKIRLLTLLGLSWIIGPLVLQATQSIDHRAQEEPIESSIWQIGTSLNRGLTPSLNATNPNTLLQILSLPWNASPTSFMGNNSGLQATPPVDHRAQEVPIAQGMWEHQIDPTLNRHTTPFFNATVPNRVFSLPPNASTTSFMGNNSGLQATPPVDHRAQEVPVAQGMWEHQIDPTLNRHTTPFFNATVPNQVPSFSRNGSPTSFIGNNSMLQATQPVDHRAQEVPVAQDMWEHQIDPTLNRHTTPLFNATVPNQVPSLPPNGSPSSFIGCTPLLMYNNDSINNSSMDTFLPHMDSYNLLANPYYYLPECPFTPSRSSPAQSQPLYFAGENCPSMSPLPARQPTPPPQVSPSKDKQATVAIRNLPIAQKKICEYCNKSFTNQSGLKRHIRIHTNEKPFQCTYCNKSFTRQSSLKRHIRIHTKEKPFQCTYCTKSFRHRSTLTSHIRMHTNEKPYSCIYCDKTFAHNRNMKKHIRTHTKEKPFVCTYCSRGFAQKSDLKRHIRIHTNEKSFECTYCHKKFAKKSNLKVHIRTHTNEEPFECTYCHKTFSHKSNLKVHIRTHTNERPFECRYCQKTFVHKSNLTKHIKSKHTV